MEITYQGLRIVLPLEGVIQAEDFRLTASFNNHAEVSLLLLMKEEGIEDSLCSLPEGAAVEIYEEEILFRGKVSSAEMVPSRGIHYLQLKAVSYTSEWDLRAVSQSFLNLDATYGQVMRKVLEDQPCADIMDCITGGAVIPDFLLQYEETDWAFLIRLASHFQSFLVPDYREGYGRAYFGIPKFEKEYELGGEEYETLRDMDQYHGVNLDGELMPQEMIRWNIRTGQSFFLAQRVRFRDVSAIVTKVQYSVADGALCKSYELSREKGCRSVPLKNPNIYGMSIPATVKQRSGNCVRVQMHIDGEYDTSPNVKLFTYAIESSLVYCMPEPESQVHIYFPSDEEKDAIAVHAVRAGSAGASSAAGASGGGYAQNPDHKSFSNVNGAELLLAPSFAGVTADQERTANICLDTEGSVSITGSDICLDAVKNLTIGGPEPEDGEPAESVELYGGTVTVQIGEGDAAQIELTEEARIIAAFIKLDASDRTPAQPSVEFLTESFAEADAAAMAEANSQATAKLVEKYEEGSKKFLSGILKVITTVAVVAVVVVGTLITGGAAALAAPAVLATCGLGATTLTFAAADISEGVQDINGGQSGNLDQSYNFLRDSVFGGNQAAYDIAKMVNDIAFGVVSGQAMGTIGNKLGTGHTLLKLVCGSDEYKKFKTALQIGSNVFNGMVQSFIQTGTVNVGEVLGDVALGTLQGFLGTNLTDGIMDSVGGIAKSRAGQKFMKGTVGTLVDTFIDWAFSSLTGREFDVGQSLTQNATTNFLAAFISDPVDAVTGSYYLHATDFILASIPRALSLERTYRSTSRDVSCLGRGWTFPYGSRIYRDTKQEGRIHMQTVTGHALWFEEQDGRWVNQAKGTGRYSLEIREEERLFRLNDVVEHTVCQYDATGCLMWVEYPNRQRLTFDYDEGGLCRITTPLGNYLEVVSKDGKILQITDEIGRRNQYRYEGDFLTDVVHIDEGITHYEYDEQGHITSVTDQNGSRYLENEYDESGRITRQGFVSGVYQTFVYDDAHRRNTIFYSETGKTEQYEYNDQFLMERAVYDDGTYKAFSYSDDNLRTAETSRLGFRKEWEYDTFGRVIWEKSSDGYEVCHTYDGNHDLVHTWDTDGRETQYVYDNAHNKILTREKISDGKWRETVKEYDSVGRCTLERDALGNETLKEYEQNCVYPSRVITPKGEETAYSYDAVGRRMTISNAYGTVELAYNTRNFVTRRTDGEGHTSHKFYDRMGNLTAYYPPEQWKKKEGGYEYRYDFLERIVDTISPLQEHKRVFRNFDGDITKEIHPVSFDAKGDEGEGTRYEYDADGNCSCIYYPDGGMERRFYDADGNMVKQIQPESYDAAVDDGDGYRYAYDSCGRLTTIQDPEGNILHTYEYNGHGQIIREVDGEGRETLYTYNGLGLKTRELVKIREANADNGSCGKTDNSFYRVIIYSYDNQGNKVEEAYGQQEVTKDGEPESWHKIYFSYDQNNHLTFIRDDFGAQVYYDYDCLGNVTLEDRTVADKIRNIVHYTYNKNGWRIQKAEDIQGNGSVQSAVTRYDYDSNGNLTKITTPKGFIIRRKYDADDRLTEERVIDKRNSIDRRVQYTYDAAGNILRYTILGADGECIETGFHYDLKDRLTHRKSPSGATVHYLYDQNDRLLKETSPYAYESKRDVSAGIAYAYDSRGNCIRITNALGEVVQNLSYNLQDLPIKQEDAFGNITELAYGIDGQIKDVRRGNGNRNGTSHDTRMVQRTLQQYEYNARGQITGIVDGNRNHVSYDVDGWGRIIGIGFADGVKECYKYTPAGRVSSTVDGNGNSIQYRYNSLGKVSERIDQLGYTETFQYDEEGNMFLHIDRDGRRTQRTYNVFGKPVYEKATDAEGSNPGISTWHYDSLGRVIRAVCDGHSYEYVYDAQGNLKEKRSSGKLLVSYTYDNVGQIKEIKDPAGICTRYEYDILGRRSRIFNDQGLEVCYRYDSLNRIKHIRYENGVETTYEYDGDGNISSLETRDASETLLSFRYRYDGNGNRTAKAGNQARAADQGGVTAGSSALDISYRYGVRGQLLEERRDGVSVCYTYDKVGNRIRKTDTQGETVYQHNQKNQLLYEKGTIGTKCFTYDAQGGILEEKSLTGVRRFAYNSRHQLTRVETEDEQVQESRYDAEGLRFELLENGKRTSFVYHNGEILHEEGGEEKQTSYHLGVGIDAFKKGKETYYYHRDEQLSTALITGIDGIVQNSYQYDAFGNQLEGVEQVTNRICYTGQQYDELTEQYYLRARYYNPILGRFMQEDVYQGDGLNLYAYCKNNPVIYYDPSGYGNREQYMGGTLRLNSPGGRTVLNNMYNEGFLQIENIISKSIKERIEKSGFEGIKITNELKEQIEFFSIADGEWHNLSEGNMSHIRNAVDAWNEEYYKYGPKSEKVREFMKDPDNYYIETEHANKSDGQKLGTYRDPEPPNEEEVKSSACN